MHTRTHARTHKHTKNSHLRRVFVSWNPLFVFQDSTFALSACPWIKAPRTDPEQDSARDRSGASHPKCDDSIKTRVSYYVPQRGVHDMSPSSASSTSPPPTDRPVERSIGQFIPRHVWTYAEPFMLSYTSCLGRRVSWN